MVVLAIIATLAALALPTFTYTAQQAHPLAEVQQFIETQRLAAHKTGELHVVQLDATAGRLRLVAPLSEQEQQNPPQVRLPKGFFWQSPQVQEETQPHMSLFATLHTTPFIFSTADAALVYTGASMPGRLE